VRLSYGAIKVLLLVTVSLFVTQGWSWGNDSSQKTWSRSPKPMTSLYSSSFRLELLER
jgi:hypothetical protein